MNIPTHLKYTKSHEWVKLEEDGTATTGITIHAQELLGDMVFVEIPQAGHHLKQGEECAVVESVKAAADVYAPISGEVISINPELESAPEKINEDPYGKGWMVKIIIDENATKNQLLDSKKYNQLIT